MIKSIQMVIFPISNHKSQVKYTVSRHLHVTTIQYSSLIVYFSVFIAWDINLRTARQHSSTYYPLSFPFFEIYDMLLHRCIPTCLNHIFEKKNNKKKQIICIVSDSCHLINWAPKILVSCPVWASDCHVLYFTLILTCWQVTISCFGAINLSAPSDKLLAPFSHFSVPRVESAHR